MKWLFRNKYGYIRRGWSIAGWGLVFLLVLAVPLYSLPTVAFYLYYVPALEQCRSDLAEADPELGDHLVGQASEYNQSLARCKHTRQVWYGYIFTWPRRCDKMDYIDIPKEE